MPSFICILSLNINSSLRLAPYERRERRETSVKSRAEEMLLVQSIQITDKFGFEEQKARKSAAGENYEGNETTFTATDGAHGFCVNAIGEWRDLTRESYAY